MEDHSGIRVAFVSAARPPVPPPCTDLADQPAGLLAGLDEAMRSMGRG